MSHVESDRLVLLALGETEPGVPESAHLNTCTPCADDLTAMRAVIDVGRETRDLIDLPAPPDRVWAAIASETGIATLADVPQQRESEPESLEWTALTGRSAVPDRPTLPGRPAVPGGSVVTPPAGTSRGSTAPGRPAGPLAPAGSTGPSRRPKLAVRRGRARSAAVVMHHGSPVRRRWSALIGVAVAAVVLGVVGTIGVTAIRDDSGARGRTIAGTTLTPQDPAAAGATGNARLVRVNGVTTLRLSVVGMPRPVGFYEVWLYDPDAGVMVPIGTVGTGPTLDLPIPSGLDTDAYRIVDISAQPLNGDPTHGRSMLRGTLR